MGPTAAPRMSAWRISEPPVRRPRGERARALARAAALPARHGSAASRRRRFAAATSRARRRRRCARRPRPRAPPPASISSERADSGSTQGGRHASSSRARASTPAIPSQLRLRQRSLQQLADALEVAGTVQRVRQLESQLEPLGRVLRQERAARSRRLTAAGASPRATARRPADASSCPPRAARPFPFRRCPGSPCDAGTPARGGSRAPPPPLSAIARRHDEPVREPLVQLGPDLLRQSRRTPRSG